MSNFPGARGRRNKVKSAGALAATLAALPCLAMAQGASADPQAPAGATQTAPLVVAAPVTGDVLERAPTAQSVSTVDLENSEAQYRPNFNIGDVLREVPGVSFKQGNGPRDITLSIRGSNARNGFGIRNTVLLEDGFRVTQPDGLGRTDITDPHAYGAIDVYRGPQSALFGNYATGGAINFNMRRGKDVDGVELGSEFGSFGFFNDYATIGGFGENHEYTLFGSYTRGDGFITHSGFETITENILGSYSPTPYDTLTLKIINNDLSTELPIRLSLNQFNANPFQKGCEVAGAAPGCATINLFRNGISGAQVAQSADQADLGRDDRRTIVGARWAHNFDADTVGRVQTVLDYRDISQPTGTTSARGPFPSANVLADLTNKGKLFGLDATHYGGVFFEYEHIDSDTIQLAPGGLLGAVTNNQEGYHLNTGVRVREDVKIAPEWTGVAGLGVEYTEISVDQNNFVPGAAQSNGAILARRDFFNAAPEAGLVYRPADEWAFRGRVAGGYGTPASGNLFVTPAGVPGNNTNLESQRNVGVDLGTDWTPTSSLRFTVTGFYEWFKNELVTQSPGAGLQNFTFNAPASEHRGIEATAEWKAESGWHAFLGYTLDDQIFSDFTERLSAGGRSAAFDRGGNKIPGVEPQELFLRFGYDQPSGPLAGLGGFLELNWHDSFFLDNANLIKSPGYELLNFNLHYVPQLDGEPVKGAEIFFNVQNLLDKTYVASANNISDTISAATGLQNGAGVLANSGSIFAGAPRSFIGGVRVKF